MKFRALSVILCLLLTAVSCRGAWSPAKGAVIPYPVPASLARWLWVEGKPAANNDIALFRMTLEFKQPVKKAVINAYFDDTGSLWINGKSCRGRINARGVRVFDAGKLLRKGRNVIAALCRNYGGSAGVILFGKVTMADGKIHYLYSSKSAKAKLGSGKDKWYAPDFDDSKWKNSRELGDVISQPWAAWRNYVEDFTTPAEKARCRAAERKAFTLPPALAKEKFSPASVAVKDGMPWIKHGKEYLLPVFSQLNTCPLVYTDSWIIRHSQLGVKIFHVTITDEVFLKSDGRLDFSLINKAICRILNLAPDARIIVQFRLARMRHFCLKNPDEAMAFGTGPVDRKNFSNSFELYGRPLRASAASLLLRGEIDRSLKGFAKYINSHPWGKRVIGVRVSYGIYCEWHSYGMYQAPDMSKPSLRAFRSYLKKKYKTVAALRKAWKDPAVTFENAAIPTAKERENQNRFFRDPAAEAKVLDFYDCYAHVHADLLLFMAQKVKELLPGRLCGAYYGYALSNHPAEGSTVLLDKVLASPFIDFLSSPPAYNGQTRLAGGDYLSRSIANSFVRHGKLLTIEDDSRFHHLKRYTPKSFTTRTALESRMTMRRNMVNMLFERCGIQFCDPIVKKRNRPGAFDDPAVDQGLKEGLAVIQKALPVARESGNDTAVVFSTKERLLHSADRKKVVLGQRINNAPQTLLRTTGIAFDLLSLTDFVASAKKYKTVVFLNAFTFSQAERKALKARLRSKGTTALFFSAAGYVTPEGFSCAAMEELTGMKISADKKGKNCALKFDKAGTAGVGKNGGAEVRFYVNDPAAVPFGFYTADKKPGAAVKKLADGSKVIYVGNYPVTAAQWRMLLLKAGAKPFASAGSYLRRHGNLILFHTGRKGTHKITLPAGSKGAVELFTGKKYSGRTVSVISQAGPATWVFKIF